MSSPEKFFLGVDLGGTNVRVVVMDSSGGIEARTRRTLGFDLSIDAVCEKVVTTCARALEKSGRTWADLAGVGLGVAAQVRAESGMLANAPNLGWRDVPLGKILQDKMGSSVEVVNDLDAIAWAEKRFGAARGHDDVMVVFCGTGVGGGLVLAGRPYHGVGGVACEIGHIKVAGDDGELCGCGGRGCLEAYLGGRNLSARLVRMAQNGWKELLDLAYGDLESIHPGLLETLAGHGDIQAMELLDELGDMLAEVLANAVTLLNLSAVVLGGTVLKGCPWIRQRTESRLLSRALKVSAENLLVLDDVLGDWAGAIGAAILRL